MKYICQVQIQERYNFKVSVKIDKSLIRQSIEVY